MSALEDLSRTLHRRYSADAAQEALLALVTRSTPPRNPLGFCRRVAWRYDFGNAGGAYNRGGVFDHSIVPLDFDVSLPPTQLARVEARETLRTLDPLDLARGFGTLDPEPRVGDEAPRPPDPRRQWAQRIRRQQARRAARGL